MKAVYNNKYLSIVHEEGDTTKRRFLKFDGDEVVSPYTKFEVERAKCGLGGLVHLRCCYNNKYLQVNHTGTTIHDRYLLCAMGEEPEEDQSKWTCTLLKPVCADQGDASRVRFWHVQRKAYVSGLKMENSLYNNNLCLSAEEVGGGNGYHPCQELLVTDWDSLVILPRYIALTEFGYSYLGACSIQGHPCLQFSPSFNNGDPTVVNQLFTNGDGSVRIKSVHFGKFWRRTDHYNYIWVDADDETSCDDPDCLFWPVKVDYDQNVIALQNLGNKMFVKRFTLYGGRRFSMESGLSAFHTSVLGMGRMGVEEAVVSRRIYNVRFRAEDARIYNQHIEKLATGLIAGGSILDAKVEDIVLTYTDSKKSTWNNIVSLKFGVKTHIRSEVPFVENGKVEILDDFEGECCWGEVRTVDKKMESVVKAVVKPLSSVKIVLKAARAHCDVPFSYTQCDTLLNGEQVLYEMDDGVYTGINYFNFQTEITDEISDPFFADYVTVRRD
ncbi:hypothetical protein Tsubulata_027899 [Turnera subulata]|uniref:Agglutinin domain-containing protein n=1 Tax=Turnera subulata TaxID=218843 RepID=A0A9Q0FZF9_9ROSI|nr:hypothetical protein Tsubulata_027899 [Turnera subulata]